MGVPTSEVGYTIATTRRETMKVHNEYVVALGIKTLGGIVSVMTC